MREKGPTIYLEVNGPTTYITYKREYMPAYLFLLEILENYLFIVVAYFTFTILFTLPTFTNEEKCMIMWI